MNEHALQALINRLSLAFLLIAFHLSATVGPVSLSEVLPKKKTMVSRRILHLCIFAALVSRVLHAQDLAAIWQGTLPAGAEQRWWRVE